MKPLLIGLFIINLCSGDLSANRPLMANIPGIAQTIAAPQAFEKVLNETTVTLHPNAPYKLNIPVKIGTSYGFIITEVAPLPPVTPSTGTTEESSANSTGLPPTISSSHTPTSSSSHTPTSSSPHTPTSSSSHTPTWSSSYAPTWSSSYAPTWSSSYAPTWSPPYAPTWSSSYAPTWSSPYAPTRSSSYAPTWSSSYAPTWSSPPGGLNRGNRLELNIHVQPGSSNGFDTTNTENSEPAVQIHVKVTMCDGNEEDAETVERSKNNSYEISAEKIELMLKMFRCSETSRVMNLIIYADIPMNITVVGYATSPSPISTHTPTHTSTAASTTPPASSIGTGWIVAIVLITIIVMTLIFAVAIFVYFYMKRRRGSINKDREDLSKRQSFVNEVLTRTSPLRKTENGYETPQPSSMIITLPHDTPIILNNPQIIQYSDFPIFHHNSPISHHPYIPQQLTKTSMDQEDSEGYIEITK